MHYLFYVTKYIHVIHTLASHLRDKQGNWGQSGVDVSKPAGYAVCDGNMSSFFFFFFLVLFFFFSFQGQKPGKLLEAKIPIGNEIQNRMAAHVSEKEMEKQDCYQQILISFYYLFISQGRKMQMAPPLLQNRCWSIAEGQRANSNGILLLWFSHWEIFFVVAKNHVVGWADGKDNDSKTMESLMVNCELLICGLDWKRKWNFGGCFVVGDYWEQCWQYCLHLMNLKTVSACKCWINSYSCVLKH